MAFVKPVFIIGFILLEVSIGIFFKGFPRKFGLQDSKLDYSKSFGLHSGSYGFFDIYRNVSELGHAMQHEYKIAEIGFGFVHIFPVYTPVYAGTQQISPFGCELGGVRFQLIVGFLWVFINGHRAMLPF
jgi:hypothetical protein